MNSISILGCGWLGLPLGVFLHNKNFQVKGSTTSIEKLPLLVSKGISPYLLTLQPTIPESQQKEWADFLQSAILIINIPPKISTQGADFHVHQIQQVVDSLPSDSVKVIYISSTSVYPDTIPLVTEDSVVEENNSMIQAEKLLKGKLQQVTILRCGGLMGYDRIPGKYVAGKHIQTGNVPVNFVHQDDVIGIIYEIIQQDKWNETYNVVAPEHPLRRNVYAKNCEDFMYIPPIFDDAPTPDYKIVSGEKLIQALKYTFVYPNPVYFKYG